MKERSGSNPGGMNVGSASIVMVFAVLALTVFAVLTLVTARSELNLAKKTAQAVADFYAADSEAARTANEFIAAGELPDGADTYSYPVEIDDNQQLCITLVDDGSGIGVYEWRVSPNGVWESDDSLTITIPDF